MTRTQYLALCVIGAIAVIAYMQSYQIGQELSRALGGTDGKRGAGSVLI